MTLRWKRSINRRIAGIAALAAVSLVAAGCSSSPSDSGGGSGASSITLVSQPNGAALPLYVAKKHGFFKDVGLNVNIKYYKIGSAALAAGANNEWQAGWLGAPPALTGMNQFDLIPAGIMIQEDKNHIMFMSKKVLNGSSPAEVLKTHSVATAQNSLADQVMTGCIQHFGVDPSTVKVVNLDPGAIVQALKSGQVQVINSWASPDFSLLDDSKYRQVCNGQTAGVRVLDPFVVTQQFAEESPDKAAAFLAAVYRANEFINSNHNKAVNDMMEIYQQNGIKGSEEMADYEINVRDWYSLEEAVSHVEDGSTAAGLKASARFFIDKGVYSEMPPVDDLLKQGLELLKQAQQKTNTSPSP